MDYGTIWANFTAINKTWSMVVLIILLFGHAIYDGKQYTSLCTSRWMNIGCRINAKPHYEPQGFCQYTTCMSYKPNTPIVTLILFSNRYFALQWRTTSYWISVHGVFIVKTFSGPYAGNRFRDCLHCKIHLFVKNSAWWRYVWWCHGPRFNIKNFFKDTWIKWGRSDQYSPIVEIRRAYHPLCSHNGIF